jgi:hypothetical protein
MKRVLLIISVVLVVSLVIYLLVGRKEEARDEKPVAITNTNNSAAFNASYQSMLTAYYSLKDALVAGDTTKATTASQQLAQAASAVKLDELTADTTGLVKENARSFTSNISSSASAVSEASGLEAKRKEFETITDPLWNLTRTVNYDEQQVYYQYCPMAFDDRGAYWLSNETAILNPYFGDKMLRCGSVEDSLRISR